MNKCRGTSSNMRLRNLKRAIHSLEIAASPLNISFAFVKQFVEGDRRESSYASRENQSPRALRRLATRIRDYVQRILVDFRRNLPLRCGERGYSTRRQIFLGKRNDQSDVAISDQPRCITPLFTECYCRDVNSISHLFTTYSFPLLV